MKVTVGTSAVKPALSGGRGSLLIQNLGPGNVYFDTVPGNVTVASGVKLSVGDVYESLHAMASDDALSLISDQTDTDVRIVVMGGF